MSAKNGKKATMVEKMLCATSGCIMRAMALTALHEKKGAADAWLIAAEREEEVACMLEAEGEEIEAAIHYVSAASCYGHTEDYARAMPLLRAALSFPVRDAFRRKVERLLKEWRPKARNQLRRRARTQAISA